MGLINWIFDIFQEYQIGQLQKETAQAQAGVRGAGGGIEVERLERALGELALAVKTLQRTLVDKGVCTSEELYNKLRQVDLEDGQADGRAPLP